MLGEAGGHVEGVESVQDGKVLCDLIDVLAPDAGLQAKVKVSLKSGLAATANRSNQHATCKSALAKQREQK